MVLPRSWLPRLSSACCCWSVETCCNIQGYFRLIYNILAFIGLGFAVADLRYRIFRYDYWLTEMLGDRLFAVILLMLFVAVSFGSTVAFLRGIFKRKPRLFVLYNGVLAVHLVLDLMLSIWAFVLVSYRWYTFLFTVPDLVIWCYSLLCAEMLYHEMLDKQCAVVVERSAVQPGGVSSAGSSAGSSGDPSAPPAYGELGSSSLSSGDQTKKGAYHLA